MKFYDRKTEIAELQRIQKLAFSDCSRMTVITGRRRIGKTSLITKALEAQGGQQPPVLYFFVSRKSETALCREFAEEASAVLGVLIPSEIKDFGRLFRVLIEAAVHTPFNLVLDEFQEFESINKSIFSDIQSHWDQLRKKTKMNLVISGSVYSLMHKIFRDKKEPLFGRADNIIELRSFLPSTLKEIIKDGNEKYTNDDILALYTFTGGVPKYVELLFDNRVLTVKEMISFMARDNSPFIDEGRNLLITEFGKNYGTYFSILQAISEGATTQSRIEDAIGDRIISGYLKRLIEDYRLVIKKRPILAKDTSHTVRFELDDNFLRFWFAYFEKYRALVEIGNFDVLRDIITKSYTSYSGWMLERYFKEQLAETKEFTNIGSWWEPKAEQNEIDIIAIRKEKNLALAVEVKRKQENFRISKLEEKVEHLRTKAMPKYHFELKCLTLEDM